MTHFKNYLILVAIVIYNTYIFNNVSAEEVQQCNEVLLNDNLIKAYPDNKFKALWKYAKALTNNYLDNEDLHDLVYRYLKYLQSYKSYNDKILKPSIWCDKVKSLCLESLRMAGFKFVKNQSIEKNRLQFYENLEKAKNMDEADIPQSGVASEYIRFVRSHEPHKISINKSTRFWCYKKCTENMEVHGFGKDIYLSLKRKVKKFKKDHIKQFTGCAKEFTQYYLSESNNISQCISCDNDIPSTIEHWCTNQCI